MIQIVSSNNCPYCVMAKNLLNDLNITYAEITVEIGSQEMQDIIQKSGLMTVPQIFIGDISKENLLGGYSELSDLHNKGQLLETIK